MTDDLACKITDSELEVMKLLWQSDKALTITELREKLQKSKRLLSEGKKSPAQKELLC